MNSRAKENITRSSHRKSSLAFWMISLMHDNPLLPIYRNPYKLLEAAGLKQGQMVIEVGCGPGYFTLPAAKIVGHEGLVYALDVNPHAIERVKGKIAKGETKNVVPVLANAFTTGLPDHSIDLAFVFGLRYIEGGLRDLAVELHRILNNGGILSFEKTRGSEKELIAEVGRLGFSNFNKKGRILSFRNAI